MSLYELDNIYGISLGNNNPQLFSFNENNNKLTFSYPHNINITFQLFNKEKYNVDLLLNDIHIKKFKLKSDYEIILESEELKDYCQDFINVCKILIFIESQNYEKESFLKITINNNKNNSQESNYTIPSDYSDIPNHNDNDNDQKDQKDDDKNPYLIYAIIVCAILTIIIIVMSVAISSLAKKNKKKDLIISVNSISFSQEKSEDEKAQIFTD